MIVPLKKFCLLCRNVNHPVFACIDDGGFIVRNVPPISGRYANGGYRA